MTETRTLAQEHILQQSADIAALKIAFLTLHATILDADPTLVAKIGHNLKLSLPKKSDDPAIAERQEKISSAVYGLFNMTVQKD